MNKDKDEKFIFLPETVVKKFDTQHTNTSTKMGTGGCVENNYISKILYKHNTKLKLSRSRESISFTYSV